MNGFEEALDAAHRALDGLMRGDPEPVKQTFSQQDDVTLANPFGGILRGRQDVERGIERAAAAFSDGTYECEEISRYVSDDLAYVLEIERFSAKLAGAETHRSGALRVTIVFRREGATWKIVHRQADPLVEPQPLASLTPE